MRNVNYIQDQDELKQLKHLGHKCLEKYVQSTLRVQNDKKHYSKKLRAAYHRLAQELRTDAHHAHFGNMNTIEEVQRALSVLAKWTQEIGESNMQTSREYIGEYNLHIDGRAIPYQLFTARHYFAVKHNIQTEEEMEDFIETYHELYHKVNQIIALKQSCVLLRHTTHSCGSLSDDLYSLKMDLIHEVRERFGYEFDEDLMESYPSMEEHIRLDSGMPF